MDDGGLGDPSHLYAKGCVPDVVLALRDGKGHTICRLRAVRALLAAWSPVLRNALECLSLSATGGAAAPPEPPSGGHGAGLSHSGSAGCLVAYGGAGLGTGSGLAAPAAAPPPDGGAPPGCSSPAPAPPLWDAAPPGAVLPELPVLVGCHKEVEAWKVALCLIHPLDPTCGRSPAGLITTCAIRPLVTLADKYNIAGLLPYCKDVLLDPRNTFGVPGIHDSYRLDALEWVQIAEGVPGFDAVVTRCTTQIVASATTCRGRSTRVPGGDDQSRYRAHDALVSAMGGLRPETCAKLASALASCLAVACENMANQDRYSIKPVSEATPWGWVYQYEPLRKST
ncbi:hypothetical protein HT031_005930 [Scenedesmus sp. PABB004]|nr:hypothetical protein HT031_005930 [Scenedesmus sp. PABB004]